MVENLKRGESLKAMWLSGGGARLILSVMIPGSGPPPFYALDLLSGAPSSTHSLCAVYSLLVCLWLAGIVKNYVFFFSVSVSSFDYHHKVN